MDQIIKIRLEMDKVNTVTLDKIKEIGREHKAIVKKKDNTIIIAVIENINKAREILQEISQYYTNTSILKIGIISTQSNLSEEVNVYVSEGESFLVRKLAINRVGITSCRKKQVENKIKYIDEKEIERIIKEEISSRINEWKSEELFGGKEGCVHLVESGYGGGITCSKCGGWFCY